MSNSVKFLVADLLSDDEILREIDHWAKVMNRPQGWHYDLDVIWILRELEKAGIKKGDTVLDAGAGMGVMQFVLAARGYNVISLDFSNRVLPKLAEGIFNMEVLSEGSLDYVHDYMGFVDYGTGSESGEAVTKQTQRSFGAKLIDIIKKGPIFGFTLLKNNISTRRNKRYNESEKNRDHSGFGKISFIRAAFHQIPLADKSVDAVISVSAIEHADKQLMELNLSELKRIVKDGKILLISTSATNKNEDIFHDKTRGWCFSKESLRQMASLNDLPEFGYEEAEKNILASKKWLSRIDTYYTGDPESDFYKRRPTDLAYLPVGIKLIK
jgi:ubiquinone/menaquinone biosynthesis C-methylase UbiE